MPAPSLDPARFARETPERIALHMEDGSVRRYGELLARANRTAHLLRRDGLRTGDGIALLVGNRLEYFDIVWAAQRSGLYFTPINTLLQRDEIHYLIDNCEAKALFVTAELLPRLDIERLRHVRLYCIDGNIGRHTLDWPGQIEGLPDDDVADACEGSEMLYSSGTTGRPKGIRLPVGAPLGSVTTLFRQRLDLYGMDEHTRYLSTAPLYHSAPLKFNMMVMRRGGTSLVMQRFDAERALALIEQHRITHSQWVPTMFKRLLDLPEAVRERHDLSSLRYAIHAAAPCPVAVKQAMLDWWGPIVYEYYSGTEGNGQTAISAEEWLARPGSVGRAILGRLHILDEDYNELPVGEVGTVFFADGGRFEYFRDPQKTRAATSPQGWTTLGDIGCLDRQGYLYLKDRRAFTIISGGVNIYPQETEDCLGGHPAVSDVAVFGVPDDDFGERVHAVVQARPGLRADDELAEQLIAWCRERIAHFKCPKTIDFRDDLPRQPTGKLMKETLRAEYRNR